jgi:hypothetical protein
LSGRLDTIGQFVDNEFDAGRANYWTVKQT